MEIKRIGRHEDQIRVRPVDGAGHHVKVAAESIAMIRFNGVELGVLNITNGFATVRPVNGQSAVFVDFN